MRIRISWDRGQVIAQLSDSAIARKMSHTLPLRTKAETWGDEIYFKFPVQAELDTDAVDVVEPGTVCYWVEGQSAAIPFGPTPIAKEGECRLATRANVLGQILDDPALLETIQPGESLHIRLVGRTPWD